MRKWPTAVLCSVLLVGVTACGALNPAATRWKSPVWSGYALTGGHYREVSASWVQPAVKCSVTPHAHSSFWSGLDGWTSDRPSIEQVGIDAYCSHGRPTYSAWYDAWPKPKYWYFSRYSPVKPGDRISASVTADRNGRFTLIVADQSEGWIRKSSQTLRTAKLATAEVIAESPTDPVTLHPDPLADFGTVRFIHVSANGQPFDHLSGRQQIYMVKGETVNAAPSPMTNGTFSVTWKHP